VKKLLVAFLCLLFAGLCACGQRDSPDDTKTEPETQSATKPTEANNTNENDPYSDAITMYYDLPSNLFQANAEHYFLYDIDGDGIQELLLGKEWGGQTHFIAVYAVQDGLPVLQKEFTDDPECGPPALLFENGTIRVNDFDGGRWVFFYYRFEDGELKFQTGLVARDYDNYYSRFDEWGGPSRVITKGKFDRLQKEFEGDGQLVELDWKPLAEYGR